MELFCLCCCDSLHSSGNAFHWNVSWGFVLIQLRKVLVRLGGDVEQANWSSSLEEIWLRSWLWVDHLSAFKSTLVDHVFMDLA